MRNIIPPLFFLSCNSSLAHQPTIIIPLISTPLLCLCSGSALIRYQPNSKENSIILFLLQSSSESCVDVFNCKVYRPRPPSRPRRTSTLTRPLCTEITSPSVSPEPGHAKPMRAPLSKAPPQLLTLINLMWRSVEGTV